MKQCVRITPQDNVATLLIDLAAGEYLMLEDGSTLQARENIPYGHKIALEDIPAHGNIIKYNEVIARAQSEIRAGEWVHIHNCCSARGGDIR